jgi:hypothetical protein
VRRHDLEPGRLVIGLVLLAMGLAYTLDAAGAWDIPSWLLIPVVTSGLALAALVSALTSSRRRARRITGRDHSP